jgi:hypothetical protein
MYDLDDDPMWKVVKVLPTDYKDYGGQIERWDDPEKYYPDCASGCRHWRPLYDKALNKEDYDWGVCSNLSSPRAGLLTWEHQAGSGCFSR